MDDAVIVRRFERFGDLPRDGQNLVERQRAARDQHRQIVALDQLHHERADRLRFLDAVDRADVGMIQRRECLRFAREARQAIGIARHGLRQDLQRDLAIQLRVARAIDLAHAAGAKEREDFVGTEPGARSQPGKYRRVRERFSLLAFTSDFGRRVSAAC